MATNGLEAGDGTLYQHGTRSSGIPAEEDRFFSVSFFKEGTETRGKRCDELRRKRSADFPTKPGHAYHEFRGENNGHGRFRIDEIKGMRSLPNEASGIGQRGSMKPVTPLRRRIVH
jgi:hypothetical protein